MKSRKAHMWKQLEKFTNWLYDLDQDEVPEDVLPYLSHKMLVTCIAFIEPSITKYISNLNTKDLYKVPIPELAKFIKYLIRKLGIPRNKVWWFSNLERYVKYERIPLVKSYEKQYLEDWISQGILDDYFNITKPKKVRKEDIGTMKQTKQYNLELEKESFLKQKQNSDFCKSCSLYNSTMVTFDGNINSLDEQVDVLFVAEAPGETETQKGIPLIGKAGQVFRKYLNEYILQNKQLKNIKYLITNVVLCRPPNNRAPTKIEIDTCSKQFLETIIQKTKPKLIVALGTTPMYFFTKKDSGITKLAGSTVDYVLDKKYKVFITVHPSFIVRNPKNNFYYENDFNSIANILLSITNTIQTKISDQKTIHTESIYSIKLDDAYYKEFDLVNIYPSGFDKVIYKLRHKETNKIKRIERNDFYYYKLLNPYGKHILQNASQLLRSGELVLVEDKPNYQGLDNNNTLYEADIPREARHTIDWYYHQEHIYRIQNSYTPRVCYLDIEVYSNVFPEPELAEHPIVLITCKYVKDNDVKNVCYIFDKKANNIHIHNEDDKYLDIIKSYELKYFKNEASMLKTFIKDLHNEDIDILTAWNISFDIGYIYNRLKKLKIDPKILSPIKDVEPYIDLEKYMIKIPDYIVVDLLSTYRFVSYGSRESYSLDYIVRYEKINDGEGKKFKGSKFNELWDTQKVYALAYNIEDVELIYKLDKKLDLINFINEFRNVTKVPWEHVQSTARTSDALIMYFAKTKDMVVRNKIHGQSGDGTKVGAYVYPPKPGLHDYVFEADFASLYPSIIQTFNMSPTTFIAKFKNELSDLIEFIDHNTPDDYEFTIIYDPIYNPTEKRFTKKDLKQWIRSNKYIVALGGGIFKNHDEELSILADIISYLKERRKHYKKLYKETNEMKHYLAQLSYKIALNSLYGYLGFDGSRFKHTDLVNNVTLSGQLINKFCSLSFANYLRQINEEK